MLTYFERLEQAADYLVVWLQVRAPKDTGNLSTTVRKAYDEKNNPMIIIGGEVAPYAVYTNEPWLSEKWNGAVNPNQGWVQSACEEAKPLLISILSGMISQEEYNQMTGNAQADVQTQFDALAERK